MTVDISTTRVNWLLLCLAAAISLTAFPSNHVYDTNDSVARLTDGGSFRGPTVRVDASDATRGVMRLPTSKTWGQLSTLDDHFIRHGAQFGARSADEYAGMASEFFQSGLQRRLPTKLDPKTGIVRIYDPASNTFGAFNPSGTTKTFFKPDPSIHGYPTNWDYWLSRPGYAP